jgi:hypothetical protein
VAPHYKLSSGESSKQHLLTVQTDCTADVWIPVLFDQGDNLPCFALVIPETTVPQQLDLPAKGQFSVLCANYTFVKELIDRAMRYPMKEGVLILHSELVAEKDLGIVRPEKGFQFLAGGYYILVWLAFWYRFGVVKVVPIGHSGKEQSTAARRLTKRCSRPLRSAAHR